MNAKQKLHQARLNEWASRIADQKASKLTIRQWCEQNQISFHAYNYWKHLLKEEVVDQMLPDIIPLPAQLPLSPIADTVTNRPIRTNCTTIATLTVNGVNVELTAGVTEDFLRVLIKAARYA